MITVAINERTKAGKALIATAKILAEQNKGIAFIKDDDDIELLRNMITARKSGVAEKTDILSSLNKIIAK